MTCIHMASHAKGLRALVVATAMLLPLGSRAATAEQARVVPAPVLDEPATQEGTRTIFLTGGCFWGV
jgi:peptide-methionine (S)-S-oxide reductase